jgi:dUTP pyrophosphatase
LRFDSGGWLELPAGPYQIVFNEIVDLPNDLMALGRPRSSLCRMGATVSTAVWDAGYVGRSTALLTIENPAGMRMEQNCPLVAARVLHPQRANCSWVRRRVSE